MEWTEKLEALNVRKLEVIANAEETPIVCLVDMKSGDLYVVTIGDPAPLDEMIEKLQQARAECFPDEPTN